MDHFSLLRHLCGGQPERAVKTIAARYNVTNAFVENLIKQINDKTEFEIKKAGPGLEVSGGLQRELDLYPHIQKHIDHWVKTNLYRDHSRTSVLVKNKPKGVVPGKWTNPDFTLLCYHNYLYSNNTIDTVTIEVKHAGEQFDITAAYEALGHLRAAHYGFLFYYDDPTDTIFDRGQEDTFMEIRGECARYGIGLIYSQCLSDIACWNYVSAAARQTPDPRKADDFIDYVFNKRTKTEDEWFKSHQKKL